VQISFTIKRTIGPRYNCLVRFFIPEGIHLTEINKEKKLRRLGKTCIECKSGVIGKTEERVLRQFHFEKIEFACGATLESFHTANGNVSRAIHSGCTVDE
jgi:hypothetical protein